MSDNDTHRSSEPEQTDPQIEALLKDYPMPQAADGFYDQALTRAAVAGAKRQKKRWMLTGFGAAIAAGFSVLVISGLLMNSPTVPTVDPTIPGVTVALEEPRTINLVFSSATALDSATLTVSLPDGVELNGFPGQREIAWETSLNEGRNILPLTLVALTPVGGELLAVLTHGDRDREFRLQLDVS
ncbi:MAG: hypothetical protein AAF351_00570 [Pseudomonadota bacterium]